MGPTRRPAPVRRARGLNLLVRGRQLLGLEDVVGICLALSLFALMGTYLVWERDQPRGAIALAAGTLPFWIRCCVVGPFGPLRYAGGNDRGFSGIQPTGAKHIGNWLGAIRHYVKDQETFSWSRSSASSTCTP